MTTVCYELREYMRRKELNSKDTWINPASERESLECGCEYCVLASETVGKVQEVGKNKGRNEEASKANAGLEYKAGPSSTRRSEASISLELAKSGIGFRGDVHTREFFVLNRNYAYCLAV